MENSCTCELCVNACCTKPGWFMPGEIEQVAEYLNISLQELFDTKLGVDWWETGGDIFVIAPATKSMNPGEEYSADPRGECIFFENERCTIYSVRPFECREYSHSDNSDDLNPRHKGVADSWQDYKNQIIELLGYEPETEAYSGSGLFGLFW